MREEDPDTGKIIEIDDTTFWEEDGNLVPDETMNTGQWYAFSVWSATPRVDEVIGTEINEAPTSCAAVGRQLGIVTVGAGDVPGDC